jgi:hypothetical protein
MIVTVKTTQARNELLIKQHADLNYNLLYCHRP